MLEALEKESQLALATHVGISQGYLSRIAAGEEPGLSARKRFKRSKLKIALDAWDERVAKVRGAA